MSSATDDGTVLVTGACGHIGRAVCRALIGVKRKILPVDVNPDKTEDVMVCDLRLMNDLSRLFQSRPISAVIHLAGVLPSAFQADPFAGADVDLSGSLELMRQAAKARVTRFVFASSMSVYGSSSRPRPLTEDDPAMPDEPYGAAKRAVDLIGETLTNRGAIEFVTYAACGPTADTRSFHLHGWFLAPILDCLCLECLRREQPGAFSKFDGTHVRNNALLPGVYSCGEVPF